MTRESERYPVPPRIRGIFAYPVAPKETVPWYVIQRLAISGNVYLDIHYVEWTLYYTVLPGIAPGPAQRRYMN